MRLESDFPGSLRGYFFKLTSNAVSQRRQPTQALLTLAYPLLRLISHVPVLPSSNQL